MILIDTAIWVDHFRAGDPVLDRLLEDEMVLTHPFVIGELALGNPRRRQAVLVELDQRCLIFADANMIVQRPSNADGGCMLYPRSAVLALSLGFAVPTHAHDARCDRSIDLVQPRRGIISNAQTASAVALAYLLPVYGRDVIDRQLPWRAILHGEVWAV